MWNIWRQSKFEVAAIDALQIRTLCVSDHTALRPELLNLLRSKPDVLQRTSCTLGIISAYFNHWRGTPSERPVEELIRLSLSAYAGKNPHVRLFARQAAELFSPELAQRLATKAVDLSSSPREPVLALGVSDTSGLGEAVAERAVNIWVDRFKAKQTNVTATAAMDDLNYALSKLQRPEMPPASFYALFRALIESSLGERIQAYAERLRSVVLQHQKLGDPRLPGNSAKWAAIGPAGTKRFLSALARDSIMFFFNHVLPDNHDTRRRKDFWLQYHRQIRDFRVALSNHDYDRLRFSTHRDQVTHCSRIHHATTSAFIMVFEGGGRDYVIVEFSEDGNAAHIWDEQPFRQASGGIRNPLFQVTRLKHAPDEDRIIHNGTWEWRAAGKLASFGIRP